MSKKKSELTFSEGFTTNRSKNTNKQMAFDWDKAAELIKQHLDKPGLIAEAGLQGDWNYTGGVIFQDGKPTNSDYTFLSSNWAKPTLMISADDYEETELPCFTEEDDRFGADTKWDDISLTILGLSLHD